MANEQSPQTYAQAIFEQATTDWLKPLKEAAECLKPSDIEALDNPALAFPQKQEILQRVLPKGIPQEVKNFLSLLASKESVHLLPSVIAEFGRYAQGGPHRSAAKVTSAVPMTGNEKETLENKLRAHYGQEAEFEYVVDPSILGGVIVHLGDKVIDGSVSGKLAALREKLK